MAASESAGHAHAGARPGEGDVAVVVPGDIEVATVLAEGSPASAILDEVRSGWHDLVAMGSRGHGDATSLLLGSVSHKVVSRSPVPVLVVRLARNEVNDARPAAPRQSAWF